MKLGTCTSDLVKSQNSHKRETSNHKVKVLSKHQDSELSAQTRTKAMWACENS